MHICKRIFLISSKNKTNHFLLVACIWLKISELWLFNYYFLWFKIDFQDFLIKMNQYVNFHKNLRTCPKKMFRFPCRKTCGILGIKLDLKLKFYDNELSSLICAKYLLIICYEILPKPSQAQSRLYYHTKGTYAAAALAQMCPKHHHHQPLLSCN